MDSIVIENGKVYDPLLHQWKEKSLFLADGKIADTESVKEAEIRINAAGCLITPGLIDFHLHGYAGASELSLNPDNFCLPCGVTSCMDAGTAGSIGFEDFYNNVICTSSTRMYALLHVAPEGMMSVRDAENQDPSNWDIKGIHCLCSRYHDRIVGLKLRLSDRIMASSDLEKDTLEAAISLAEDLALPLVVHVNDPCMKCEDIVERLRPGDVYCHMYAGKRENILDSVGKVRPLVWEARKRGVIFDACNGLSNFLFSVAGYCMEQGFWPDIISTDGSCLVQYRQPVISLPRLLSKYLMLGMPLERVFDAAILAPAMWLKRKELASMQAGTPADVVIWRLIDKQVSFADISGDFYTGRQVLVPMMTIRDGTIVYCQSDFL